MKKEILKRHLNPMRLLRFGFLIGAVGTLSTAMAQTTVQIGAATTTTNNAPIQAFYNYSYSQSIYTASDLIANGGIANGNITKIRYYFNNGGLANSNGWTVYIGHTSLTNFANTTAWIPASSMTQCFSGTVTFPAAGNWAEITLTTPFQWNGTDNLVIGIDENQTGYGSQSYWRYSSYGTDNRTIYYYNDATNPDPSAPVTATSRGTWAPNIQLVMFPQCSGTPSHATTIVNDAQICPGQSVNLSATGFSQNANIVYSWQQNSGMGWVTLAGTSITNNGIVNPITTDYRLIQTCINSGLSDTASAVSVVMNTNPTVEINHSDIALCESEPANLSATGADTYVWTPNTMITPNANSADINAMPTAITNYTVTGTTAAGCSSTATVLVTPLALTRSTATFTPGENCAPGTPITLTISDVPEEISNGGTWEYRFLDEDGVTVLQDWSALADYTFTPATDGIYDFYYQMRSTSCVSTPVDSVKSTIIVGFGAGAVDITNFNCNSDGILSMIDTYGQLDVDTMYANMLTDQSTMATNWVLSNNASVTAGRLVLTPSATGNVGYGMLSVPNFTTGTNNSMKVSFKMTADLPINIYGTGGADGITYSFGDDATPTGNGTGHNGKGTKLRLSFDAAGNSGENGNTSGIYLVYGWTANNAFGPTINTTTLAYSSNTALWKNLTDIPVELTINEDGKASVTVNNVLVFSNVQLPAAYMSANVANWKHLFSAGTGGDAMRFAVKDLVIESGRLVYGITSASSPNSPSSWQTSSTFSDLLPGVYNLWISKDEFGSCSKNIGSYVILNVNPVVQLGNDTTLCAGESIILNAENTGGTYVWSGTNHFEQTLEVTEAGSYVAYVTDSVGCVGVGTINVDYNEAPTVTGIYSQGSYPMMTFSVLGAQNSDTYDWNFGDGNSVLNGPATISHLYVQDGTFSVSVTLSNSCGTATENTSITLIDYTSLSENVIDGLQVYPNPANTNVTIVVPNNDISEYRVFGISGAEVISTSEFVGNVKLDVSNWQSGVYFLHLTNAGISTIQKIIVE